MSDAEAHLLPVRVYYEDTDAGGVVYYANYLKYAERGRTEMLRAGGYDHHALEADHGLLFAVRHCSADYRKPAVLDDRLEVRTRVGEVKRATLSMVSDICRDGEVLVTVSVTLACISRNGRPGRIPAMILDILRAQAASG